MKLFLKDMDFKQLFGWFTLLVFIGWEVSHICFLSKAITTKKPQLTALSSLWYLHYNLAIGICQLFKMYSYSLKKGLFWTFWSCHKTDLPTRNSENLHSCFLRHGWYKKDSYVLVVSCSPLLSPAVIALYLKNDDGFWFFPSWFGTPVF